jgi:hypothetical protein
MYNPRDGARDDDGGTSSSEEEMDWEEVDVQAEERRIDQVEDDPGLEIVLETGKVGQAIRDAAKK